MHIRKTLLSAAVIVLAAVAGLSVVQGTWALWNAAVPATAKAAQAADFRVELAGQPMTVNGVAATVTLPNPSATLTPTSPVYAAVTVRNATNAGGPFTIRATAGQPIVSNASVPALSTALTVQTALTPASGGCAAAAFGGLPADAVVAKNATAGFCVRVALPANAPETLRNATATISIPVTVTQIQPGG